MSDTISHATQGSLILLGPFIASVRRRVWIWMLGIVGGFFGALPDLLGVFGYLVNRDHGLLYQSAHRGAVAGILQYVPKNQGPVLTRQFLGRNSSEATNDTSSPERSGN